MKSADDQAKTLRRRDPGIAPASPLVPFTFDGRRILGYEGETIAAALAASAQISLGTRRDGSARGLYCGMGTCQSCCIRVKKPDPNQPPLIGSDWCYRLACTDGPVFRGVDLLW